MNPKADLLALAAARGESIAEAARALGIAERTAYRWAGEDDFKARVDDLRRRLVNEAVGRLTAASGEAVAALREMLAPGVPPSARVAAARALLTGLIDLQNHVELAQRVAELEQRINESQPTA